MRDARSPDAIDQISGSRGFGMAEAQIRALVSTQPAQGALCATFHPGAQMQQGGISPRP